MMALSQLLRFLKAVPDYNPEAADVREAGGVESPAARHHARVIIAAGACGIAAAIAGTIGVVLESGGIRANELQMVLQSPVMFGIAGRTANAGKR